MSLAPVIVDAYPTDPTPEQETVIKLRAQIKVIEDEKAAAHRKRVFMEEAESLRKQIRSYGLTPAA